MMRSCVVAVLYLCLFFRIDGFSFPTPPTTCSLVSKLHRAKSATARPPQSTLQAENNNRETIVERPDPSILLSAKDDSMQQLGFVAICLALSVGTALFIQLLNLLETILPNGWFELWRDYTWPVPLGLIFLVAGVTHFVFKDSYTAFVPPPGTWGGLWQVPAPGRELLKLTYEEYHTYWSGVAEIGGGVLLILSGTHAIPVPVQMPAFLVGLLLVAVTPSNIYMGTHDIQPPNFPPVPYPEGHIVRGVLQCILLGIFWKLTFQG
jgi:uncharacterized membrane protein